MTPPLPFLPQCFMHGRCSVNVICMGTVIKTLENFSKLASNDSNVLILKITIFNQSSRLNNFIIPLNKKILKIKFGGKSYSNFGACCIWIQFAIFQFEKICSHNYNQQNGWGVWDWLKLNKIVTLINSEYYLFISKCVGTVSKI